MKFKTKGFLLKEISSDDFCDDFERGCYQGEETGIDKAFESFRERRDFYKKYESRPMDLEREQIETYNDWTKYKQDISSFDYQPLIYRMSIFNNWLFKYCFGDIE